MRSFVKRFVKTASVVFALGILTSISFASCELLENLFDKDDTEYCTVTFDTDGGSAVASQRVERFEHAVEPEPPVKEGFCFLGWYQESARDKFDFEHYVITEDTTLKARWSYKYELKSGENIYSGIIKIENYREATSFRKSMVKPQTAPFYLDLYEHDIPCWYDSETNSISYYIDAGQKLRLNSDSSKMFWWGSSLTYIYTGDFDTSHVTNMSSMFRGCLSLETLDLSSFDTSNVTDMSEMFLTCQKLQTLNISSFKTGSVTDMSGMFSSCFVLKNLDLGGFDTGNVTDVTNMFYQFKNLKDVDFSNFNTEDITCMQRMFYAAGWSSDETESSDNSEKILDLSSFNTKSAKDMSYMFYDLDDVTQIKMDKFDTSNVTDMSNMFGSCEALKELDLSNFDVSGAENVSSMFERCYDLTRLYAKAGTDWNLDTITNSENMFEACGFLRDTAGKIHSNSGKTEEEKEQLDKTYAHTSDVSSEKPGFFTIKTSE